MKQSCVVLFLIFLSINSFAQTVFTYGRNAVSKTDFVTAFNKNPGTATDRKKALKDYLELYINFRLKVQAALDEGLDKDQNMQNELENFRKQLADNIINQQANIGSLVKEAFYRSQKDINLAQVLIEIPENGDSSEAYKKIHEAYKALRDGQEFSKVSSEYSTDPATKASSGNLGYITAFTIGYEFENVAYSLKPNTFSAPYRSKFGYHIFKNGGERPGLGTRRVAQILIAFPPGASEVEKQLAERKADSIYDLLKRGASFQELAATVSNDLTSSSDGGQLPEFGINTYHPVFEQAAFSLRNNNEISRPFATASGYHIIKLLEAKPPSSDINNAEYSAYLQNKVLKDDRMNEAKKALLTRQLKTIKYRPAPFNQKLLYQLTDTALVKPSPVSIKGFSENTLLFSFEKQNVKAADWIKYVRLVRGSPVNAGKPFDEIYREFVQVSADNYYRNNLQNYSDEYRKQLKEFREANLLFAIMEKNVWGKANVDTSGQVKYYNQNKAKYRWEASADALIVTCANEAIANELQKKLSDSIRGWRTIIGAYDSQVTVDSGRFELGQLPVFERTNFTPALITLPVKNPSDGSTTFNYIINVYSEPDVKSFEQARGLVISDYQQVLEEKWLVELKKKYPVKVDMAVFNSIR